MQRPRGLKEKSSEARKTWAEGTVAEDTEEGGGQRLPLKSNLDAASSVRLSQATTQ